MGTEIFGPRWLEQGARASLGARARKASLGLGIRMVFFGLS